jgi:hypothetical protein
VTINQKDIGNSQAIRAEATTLCTAVS